MSGSLEYIFSGFSKAVDLLVHLEPETFSAVLSTVQASSMSMLASLAIGLPLGFLLGQTEFPGKRAVRTTVDTFLAFPTVVIGLLVYAFVSHRGPSGRDGTSLHPQGDRHRTDLPGPAHCGGPDRGSCPANSRPRCTCPRPARTR